MIQAFEALEAQKAKVLTQASNFPPDLLNFHPQPVAWSVLQVLEHLVNVETSFNDSVRQNLPNGHAVGWRDRAGALMVQLVMRSPMRVKTPGPVVVTVTPEATGDLPAITDRWESVRLQMRSLAESLSWPQARLGVFQHPVAGWMTVSQGMSFLSAHLIHHGYQLSRLESAYGSKMQTSRKLR